jgi:hypothetical protein
MDDEPSVHLLLYNNKLKRLMQIVQMIDTMSNGILYEGWSLSSFYYEVAGKHAF